MLALAALSLLACDDVNLPVPGAPSDAAPPADAGPNDLRPDAAPLAPDPTLPVHLSPWPNAVIEGRPMPLRVRLAADVDFSVRISGPDGALSPAQIELSPAAPEAALTVTAPFDADEAPDRLQLDVTAVHDNRAWPLVLPVLDAHHTLALQFTDAQFEAIRTTRERSDRFVGGIEIDGRPGPEIEVNLRGKGTFFCARRSFTVRFATPVRVGDSPPLEHILLLSMCEDEPYLRMRSSVELLQGVGLFPSWFTFAEVRYGEQTRGVYLVVERPRKAVSRLFRDNELVIRRIRDDQEEIDRPDEADIVDRDALLAPYRALYDVIAALEGDALLDQLDRRMDYDHYLDWLAVNSVLENGDYRDEVYFYDRPGPAGAVSPYFAILAWDYDGVQTPCHVGNPIAEPLMYCAESALDRPVRDDAAVHARYVDRLRAVLDGPLAPAAYAETIHRVAAELALYLDRPGVRAIMARGDDPLDPATAADEMAARQAERHATLSGLLP
ncbi:MAG: CotH kinase family protein [Myxococcales bacterium]|nr:CotH kinase family protein [Myxococcales bacterium]